MSTDRFVIVGRLRCEDEQPLLQIALDIDRKMFNCASLEQAIVVGRDVSRVGNIVTLTRTAICEYVAASYSRLVSPAVTSLPYA
jgi:hypothetical protein